MNSTLNSEQQPKAKAPAATAFNMFQNISVVSSSSAGIADELDRYLSEPTDSTTEPLLWWYEHRKQYPTLSLMALDYHSIPGMYEFQKLVLCSSLV